MKMYNFLSIFLLLCLSAKAQEEPITETEALSALQEALPTLNKYKLITDGNEWFLAEQEAVSAINEHNRTTTGVQRKITSDFSYKRNHHLIPGLPPNPYEVYGDKWFDMKESIATFLKDVGPPRPSSNHRGNKVFKNGHMRFLTEQEAVSAINDHNQTALAQNKIISTTSYHKNYRLIPGLPSNIHRYNPESLRSQIIGWKDPTKRTRGNKVFREGRWRFLTEQEAVSAINDHNKIASAQNKIISVSSYTKNYGLIPGLPRDMYYEYDNPESLRSQIIGWKSPPTHANKVFRGNSWRFLTEQEAISAINEHNRTTTSTQNKIISTTSYRDNYGLIPGLSIRYAFINNNRITSQIIDWEGYSAEPRHRGNKVFREGRWRSLTEQEAVSAINEHNRTTTSVQNKIISPMSYQENYGLIPGLPPNPWTHYGPTTWKVMLKKIHFDHYVYGVCPEQFAIP